MTADPAHYILPDPEVIPAKVTIEHLQLRDLLQNSSEEGKCLIVNRFSIEEVDFNRPELSPTHFQTITFRPNCLVTGNGLVAAGGQQSELFVCPLPDKTASPSTSLASTRPWKIEATTGGSINNSIAIQIDPPGGDTATPFDASSPKRHGLWSQHRSQAKGPARLDEGRAAELEIEAEGWAAARGFSYREGLTHGYRVPHTSTPRHAGNTRKTFEGRSDEEAEELPHHASKKGKSNAAAAANRSSNDVPVFVPRAKQPAPRLQLFVSNNDRCLKVYDVNPHGDASEANDLPLDDSRPSSPDFASRNAKTTRVDTLDFPTAINHSSLSPDGSTLVVVGDTPDVFVYQREPNNGRFVHLTTYQASSEASFSTTWHPDGTKFAVASQDGHVSVWDVRSSKKLAELRSSQSFSQPTSLGAPGGLNGSAGAVRTVKFSPCGRYLAFTEHRKYFHIYDTESFETGQRLAISPVWSRPSASEHAPAVSPQVRERPRRVSGWGPLERASMAAEESGNRTAATSPRGPFSSTLSVPSRRSVTHLRTTLPIIATTSVRRESRGGHVPLDRARGNATSSGYRALTYQDRWRDSREVTEDDVRLGATAGVEEPSAYNADRDDRSLSPGDVQQHSASSSSPISSDDTAEHGDSALERMRERYRYGALDSDASNDLSAIRSAESELLESEAERALTAYIPPGMREGWLGREGAHGDDETQRLRNFSTLYARLQFGSFGLGPLTHGASLGTGSNATQLRMGHRAAAAAVERERARRSSGGGTASGAASTTQGDATSALNSGFYPFADSSTSSRTNSIGDPMINIAGLCWDPNSKYLYVATEKMVCRYEVRRQTWSCPRADIR